MNTPAIIEGLRYWEDEPDRPSALPSPRPHRYVTFDIDLGGFNNIRLAFEYVAVVAAITGRTLVIPPCQPWYLINWGPMAEGAPGGCSHLGDMFDLPALGEAIPVLSTAEFIDEASEHLSIPGHFAGSLAEPWNEETGMKRVQAWRDWLFEHGEIVPWNPFNTLICMPDRQSVNDLAPPSEDYIDGRELVEFSPAMSAAPVIHFPCNGDYRSLGPVATMLAAKNPALPTDGRHLLKHHLRYRADIFAAASEFIRQLGFEQYDATHIRRNDFQYEQTRLNARAILEHTAPLLDAGLPLYIATDETDDEFFAELAAHHQVFRWQDLVDRMKIKPELPDAWVGLIEQIICAGARRFIGTDLSTFSTYINRIRGYRDAADTLCYYHSVDYRDDDAVVRSWQYRGREYLRENPLFWTDC